ncbi:uncharacterized protein [Taeniopygia guttata]|uniref:uncharacterized protein n=1 Tax=Taeniopygia guttata TaxID=59729 RepID=UPI003BB865D0
MRPKRCRQSGQAACTAAHCRMQAKQKVCRQVSTCAALSTSPRQMGHGPAAAASRCPPLVAAGAAEPLSGRASAAPRAMGCPETGPLPALPCAGSRAAEKAPSVGREGRRGPLDGSPCRKRRLYWKVTEPPSAALDTCFPLRSPRLPPFREESPFRAAPPRLWASGYLREAARDKWLGALSGPVRLGVLSAAVGLGALSAAVGLGALSAAVGLGALSTTVGLGALSAPVGLGALSAPVGLGALSAAVGLGALSAAVGLGALSTTVGLGALSAAVGLGALSAPVGLGALSAAVGLGALSAPVGLGALSAAVGLGALSAAVGLGSPQCRCGAGSPQCPCGAGSPQCPCGAGSPQCCLGRCQGRAGSC